MEQLTGTDKQIAWAEKLRAERLEQVGRVESTLSERQTVARAEIEQMREALCNETRAAWWIEHRFFGFKQLGGLLQADGTLRWVKA